MLCLWRLLNRLFISCQHVPAPSEKQMLRNLQSACGCLEVICPEQNWTECAPDIGRTQMISPIHYSRNCLSALGQMLERIDINRHSLARLGMSHATKLMINDQPMPVKSAPCKNRLWATKGRPSKHLKTIFEYRYFSWHFS